MSWLHKTIGGTAGLTLGGPLGKICGQSLSTLYESGVIPKARLRAIEKKYFGVDLGDKEASQLVFFLAMCSLLGKVVKAEGRVTRDEIDATVSIMLGPLKFSGVTLTFAKIVFNQAKKSRVSAKSIAEQFIGYHHQKNSRVPEFMIEALLVVAFADDSFDPREWRMIASIAKITGVNRERLMRAAGKHTSMGDKNYATLEIDPDSPISQVHRSKAELSATFNPNTMQRRRIPEELGRFAKSQFQAVNRSYTKVVKSKKPRRK